MQVVAIQLNSQNNVQENLSNVQQMVTSAALAGAKLVLLPENFAYFGDEPTKLQLAPEIAAESDALLQRLAIQHSIYLVGGGHPVPTENNRVFNRMSVFAPSGEKVFQYDKAHLFDMDVADLMYNESKHTQAGQERPGVFKADELVVSGAICYDVRFPELFRFRVVDILLLPAAFTRTTGEAHWHILLQARAIENQCWVIAAAQWGSHPQGRLTYGHSVIIDPWGSIVAEQVQGIGYIMANIEQNELVAIRKKLPALQHRKF